MAITGRPGRQPVQTATESAVSETDADAESDSEASVTYSTSTASTSSNKLYLQLALYAGGNILTLVIVLGLWTVWSLLSTFRDAMLWALLCSTALQDVKEHLVCTLRRHLSKERSLIVIALLLLWLPFQAVSDTLTDVWRVLVKWNQYVREYETKLLGKAEADRSTSCAPEPATPFAHAASRGSASPQKPLASKDLHPVVTQAADQAGKEQPSPVQPQPSSSPMKMTRRRSSISKRSRRRKRYATYMPPAVQAFGSWMSAYTQMGLKAYQSEHTAKQGQSHGDHHHQHAAGDGRARSRHPSNAMFAWLFKACAAYQIFLWLQAYWSSSAHAVLLVLTGTALLGLLPFAYFGLHWSWHRRHTQVQAAVAPAAELASVSEPETQPQAGNTTPQHSAQQGSSVSLIRQIWKQLRQGGSCMDSWLRLSLQANLEALVAAALIALLLLGTLALAGFLTIRIGQEGHSTLASLRGALPNTWRSRSGEAGPTCAATELNFTAICEQDADFQALATTPAQGGMQQWLGQYQETALVYAQQGYEQLQEYVKINFNDYVEANNLTQVARDLGTLWTTLQPPSDCSSAEKEALLVEVATASAAAHAAWRAEEHAKSQADQVQQRLSEAVADFERASQDALGQQGGLLRAAQDDGHPMRTSEQPILQLTQALKQSRAAINKAARALVTSRDEVVMAERRLGACLAAGKGAGAGGRAGRQLLSGPALHLGAGLQEAYTFLWKLQLAEGWSKLQGVGQEAYQMARQAVQGSGGGSGELTALQRLATAGAEPLAAVGRAVGAHLAHSLGSTTSVAITGGLGVLRLGLGVVKVGVQMMLFVAMLFLLLSAKQDPFQQAVKILPMSETARERTAASFSEALRGVFQSALKLAVFHSVFTWLTFRAFGVQLVYVPTLLSAVCAILPLVQVWMLAIPAALQLILQDRMISAALLLLLHIGAYFQADDAIMREIPGSHPYLTGLGILGGMYSFDNPLQGALLGPMSLSILSVFYKLHAKLFRDEADAPERAVSPHRTHVYNAYE